MLLREGWAKRVAIRFIPAPVTITIIVLRVVGAVVCHWLAGVLPDSFSHLFTIASHAFAILAAMMLFGAAEKAFANHVYYALLKFRGDQLQSQASRSTATEHSSSTTSSV